MDVDHGILDVRTDPKVRQLREARLPVIIQLRLDDRVAHDVV